MNRKQYQIEWRNKRKLLGYCCVCFTKPSATGKTRCESCSLKTALRYRQRHPNCTKLRRPLDERGKTLYEYYKDHNICYTCHKQPRSKEITKHGKESGQCNMCRTKRAIKYQEVGKIVNQDRKIKAFLRYGGVYCACCGISNPIFLSLDHINNDGAAHRKQIGKKAANFYTWLEDNNYPPGLQVLCHNCNQGKQINGGICPHQYEKTSV